jgi:muconate cycloisomerase
MRIKKIEPIPVRVPLKKPVESAHGPISQQESLLVRVTVEDGAYGLGAVELVKGYDSESTEEAVEVIKSTLGPLLIGENHSHVKKIVENMDGEVKGHLGSKAAVEMALFDLLGKSLGAPVHAFFGGPVHEVIQLNGWIGVVEPHRAKDEARDWIEKGFRSVKVKMNSDVEKARSRVEAVRAEGKENLQIRVDANETPEIGAYEYGDAVDTTPPAAPTGLSIN